MKKIVTLILACVIVMMTGNAFAQEPQPQKAEKTKKEAAAPKEKKVKEGKSVKADETAGGNAYGKNKGTDTSKEFGQNRSATAKQKGKKKK